MRRSASSEGTKPNLKATVAIQSEDDGREEDRWTVAVNRICAVRSFRKTMDLIRTPRRALSPIEDNRARGIAGRDRLVKVTLLGPQGHQFDGLIIVGNVNRIVGLALR